MSKRRQHADRQRRVWTARMLKAVPYVNRAMQQTPRPKGAVLASVPMKRPRYLVPPLRWVLPFSGQRRVELDAVGAEVLRLCDGQRTVESIIESFAAAHRLTFREAQLPVTQFLQQLAERGIVAIVGLQDPSDEDDDES